MRQLNPKSDKDRRITAYTFSFPIKPLPYGWIQQGTYSYDCWGDLQGGLFKQTVSKEYSKKYSGWRNSLTLALLKQGCCPPMLHNEMEGVEELPGRGEGDIEEALKMHKKGYGVFRR